MSGLGEDRQQIRALQRALADASDPQLRRVLALVDSMPERGEADQIIAPYRPRLAAMQLPRKLRFGRLLFLPLNPAIVPAAGWRRGMLAIPRTALTPLATQFAAARPGGEDAGPGSADISADRTADIARLGAALWPEAAAFFRAARVPTDWHLATGLADADHAPIAAMVAAGLAHAPRIAEFAAEAAAGDPPAEHDCEEMLDAAREHGPDGLAIITALLIARLPSATLVLQAADAVAARQKDPALRLAVDRAIDSVLGAAEQADPRPAGNPAMAEELRRMVCLLDDIEAMSNPSPSRMTRIQSLRRRLDAASRQKFTDALGATLLRPAEALATADEAAVASLETAARDLRRFERIARRLGSADLYDQRLRGAGEALRPRADDPPETVVDRVRLIEILSGPEAALAVIA